MYYLHLEVCQCVQKHVEKLSAASYPSAVVPDNRLCCVCWRLWRPCCRCRIPVPPAEQLMSAYHSSSFRYKFYTRFKGPGVFQQNVLFHFLGLLVYKFYNHCVSRLKFSFIFTFCSYFCAIFII